jgi:aspartyl-tRNA(Asn)/glutamyl-tRNA(Gln) amidotransferase subunit A
MSRDTLAKLQAGELRCAEVIDALIEAAEDDATNAFVSLADPADLRERARAADQARQDGDARPLEGWPVAIKDNICTRQLPTTAGSKMLDDFESPYEATAVQRLRDAGAIIVGKTNLDEFGMGSSSETSHVGPVRNPADPKRVAGGSSGGSAAAVAADLAVAALGSDTGGSVRQPASHCGVVGLKPTYGRVSRHGLIAYASSLDQIGPMAPTVEGCARLFEAIAGHDDRDATSLAVEPAGPGCADVVHEGVEGMTVGLPEEYLDEASRLDPQVRSRVESAIDALEDAGAKTTAVSLPHTEYAVATYYLIATAEASSNLARYDGVRFGHRAEDVDDLAELYRKSRAEGFGDEVKRRIILGTYVLSAGYYEAYYEKAQKVRTLIRRDFEQVFEDVDAVVAPVAPTPAWKLGEKRDDPLEMYLEDIFTTSANLAGIPAMSVPSGTTGEGLPVGTQLLGPALSEPVLFRLAQAVFERCDDEATDRG